MSTKLGIVGIVLLVVAAPCFSQSTASPEPDQQQAFQAHVQSAQGYLRQNRPDLAIPELQAATAIDPGNVEIQGNLGVLLYFRGNFSDAIPHLRAAVEQQAGLAKIQGLLGIAEERTSQIAEARKDLEAAFPLIPDKKFKTQAGLELVSIDTQAGDLAEAANVISQLRKSDPDNAEVMYAAYQTYAQLSSESMLALALAAPDSAQMHQAMAHEELKQGNVNGAIADYRKAIAIESHLPGIHFELAELLNSSADANVKKQAEQEYRAALDANPLDEKAVCRLGEIDAQRGDNAKAFGEFSKAAALQPADSDAKLGLAKTLIELNQPDKALAVLEETVQLEPTNATAHYRLATLYRAKGRTEDAKREIDLYKQYKAAKDKLRATYKELLKQPGEIGSDASMETVPKDEKHEQ